MNLQNNWDSFFPILATFLIDRFLATFDQRRVVWRDVSVVAVAVVNVYIDSWPHFLLCFSLNMILLLHSD